MICTVYIHNHRSYIWASCHISKASRIARMILVFFMYDPIKTETWLIFHLWFLQYSSIQPNGFYGIRMKKVSRHNKKKDVIQYTHMAHNTIMFPIKAFCPLNISINAFFVKRRRTLKMYQYIILIERGCVLNILKMQMYFIKTLASLLVFNINTLDLGIIRRAYCQMILVLY